MVGDGEEVERPVELDVEAPGVLHRLALGETVGVVRGGERAEQEGIEGVARVDMKIAEQRGLRLPSREQSEAGNQGETGGEAVMHGDSSLVPGSSLRQSASAPTPLNS